MLRVNVRLSDAEQKIDDLRREQVSYENFYINDEFTVTKDVESICFDEFTVPAGHVLDFSANFSSYTAKYENNGFSAMGLALY